MATELHPAASHHLPAFITAPGGTDYLMIIAAAILIGAVLGAGLLFLRLHTLPERMAHRAHKLQFEIVAVLGLLALFTHVHLFWVAGLLLALIDLPDISGMFGRMAGALEKIAGIVPDRGAEAASKADAAAAGPDESSPKVPDATASKPARIEEMSRA
jgi:hypothetical protein